MHFSVPDRTTSGDVVGAHMGAYGVATWGALYAAGVVSYSRLDNWMRLKVLAEDKTIQGFNVGITSLRKTSDGLPSSLPDHHHCAA